MNTPTRLGVLVDVEPVLRGQRVLVVEDELLIADVLTAMLERLGAGAIEHAESTDDALRAAERGGADLALVDLNLGGASAWPAVDRLRAAGVRVLLMTGDGDANADRARADLPLLPKPYQLEDLRRALAELVA